MNYVSIAEKTIAASIFNGDLKTLTLFLNSSEDKNPEIRESITSGKLTVLHLAAGYGHKNIIAWYYDTLGVHDINPSNEKGVTPLDIAVKQQKNEVVKFYTSKGYDSIGKC